MNPGSVSAIVLAAGLSTRMGRNKPLMPWEGTTVLGATVAHVTAVGFGEIVLVTGHEADAVAACAPPGVRIVFSPDYASGMGTSIACGVRATAPDAGGFLIHLGDMPRVPCSHLAALVAALEPSSAVATRVGDRLGSPAAFGRDFRDRLAGLTGDRGARSLLSAVEVSAVELEADLAMDLDTSR